MAKTPCGPLAESAVREVVGRRELLDLLTSRSRRRRGRLPRLSCRERPRPIGSALLCVAIAFQDIHPPLDVVDAYRDVSRAASDRQRRINEAIAYRDQTVTEASGKAEAIVQAARADAIPPRGAGGRRRLIPSARCELRAQADPALTDFRLFWEKLAEALAGKDKVVLDEEPGRRRHLIVPNLAWDRPLARLATDRPDEKAAPAPGGENGSASSKP